MDQIDILKYILPNEINSYFDLVNIEEKAGHLLLYLDEKSEKPKEHDDKDLISKGFSDAVSIQDFPLRDKSVYLKVRRRKWMDKKSKKIYYNSWSLTAKGTSYSNEFAAFLKEFVR